MLRGRGWIGVIGACLLSVGCAGAGQSVLSSAEAEPAPGPGLLVQYGPIDDLRTTWLAVPDPEAVAYEAVVSVEGAYAVGGEDLWAWGFEDVATRSTNCECVRGQYAAGDGDEEPPDEARCVEDTTVRVPVLRNLAGEERLRVLEVEELEGVSDVSAGLGHRGVIGEPSQGVVGNFWFTSACSFIYACGAHGSIVCESWVAELDGGRLVGFRDFMGEQAGEVQEEFGQQAMSRFAARDADVMGIGDVEDSELAAGGLSFSAEGVRFSYRFVAPTCYACSDGEWSSYTNSAVIEDQALPRGVAERSVALPAAVAAFVDDSGISYDDLRGWTALPASPARRATLLDLFRQQVIAEEEFEHGP